MEAGIRVIPVCCTSITGTTQAEGSTTFWANSRKQHGRQRQRWDGFSVSIRNWTLTEWCSTAAEKPFTQKQWRLVRDVFSWSRKEFLPDTSVKKRQQITASALQTSQPLLSFTLSRVRTLLHPLTYFSLQVSVEEKCRKKSPACFLRRSEGGECMTGWKQRKSPALGFTESFSQR